MLLTKHLFSCFGFHFTYSVCQAKEIFLFPAFVMIWYLQKKKKTTLLDLHFAV